MPLDPGTVTGIMTASLTGAGMAGIAMPQLAGAVATGLSTYAASGLTAISVDTGLVGSGTGTGVGIALAPGTLQGTLQPAFVGAAIAGIASVQLATAIASGFSTALAGAIINTVNVGVGSGSGVVTLVPSSGAPFFVAAFTGAGLIGVNAAGLATAIAIGLDSALPSGIGAIAIAGAAGSAPSSGSGKGKIS